MKFINFSWRKEKSQIEVYMLMSLETKQDQAKAAERKGVWKRTGKLPTFPFSLPLR